MKNINKKLIKVIALIILFQLLLTSVVSAKSVGIVAPKVVKSATFTSSDIVTPNAPEIVWIFKFINEELYKRQFNQTTGQWIGEWIPA